MADYRSVAWILAVAVMAGCVQTRSHAPAATAAAPSVAPVTSSAPAARASAPVPSPQPSAGAPAIAATRKPTPKPAAAAHPAPPATAASAPAPKTALPPAPAAPAAPQLDLASLEQRLKDTKAIGVFTKLSLKNQVDDLLGNFRDFHAKKGAVTLTQLRQQYDLLVLKVLSVLQEGDPDLAAAIARSREAIWGILVDPVRFSKL